MSGLSWGLTAPAAAVLGLVALTAWLALAPPPRSLRGIVRALAAFLLALALLDVGCRLEAGPAAPHVAVLVDRSLSMGATGRDAVAEAWLARLERSLSGWRVTHDSFGGATTDLADAIARAEASLPSAIVLISDGRAAAGRAAETPAVPLYVHAPAPLDVADLAVLDLSIETLDGGGAIVHVETAAVGGRSAPARPITVAIDGRVAGSIVAGPVYQAGERRVAQLALARLPAAAVVEARLAVGDPVAANDARARVSTAGVGPRDVLLVALRPSWEFGFVRRSLEAAAGGSVAAFWAPAPDRLEPIDRRGAASWAALSPERYRTAWLFGDPALLGAEGDGWLRRFAASGGRGILWAPAGRGGSLTGTGITVRAAGTSPDAVPALTEAGSRWLIAHGGDPDGAPDGTPAWPPLELLPDAGSAPVGATVLLAAEGRPAAWVEERGSSRTAVLLGTGYYRWRLSGEARPAAFWEEWIATLSRWLSGAATAERPLVRLPPAGRISATDTLEAAVVAEGELGWRIERGDGGRLADGVVRTGGERMIRAGPLDPGTYRLFAEVQGRRTSEPFVVESWAPDLAWTGADTASLFRAARASAGGVLGDEPRLPPPPAEERPPARQGRTIGLGTTPWLYLAVVVLLLLDWGIGARSPLR